MPSRPKHDSTLVAWLSLAQLITWGSVFYTFALLMEPVERELGLTRAQSSLAFSLCLLTEGALAFPVGRWIDRGHERAVMTLGSLAVGALLALHTQVNSIWGFYAVWTALGAAMAGTLYTPAFAVITRRFPHDFRRGIITLTFLGGLASTVFIPLSAWLITHLGWRQALWVLVGLQWLVCAPVHAWTLRDAPGPVQRAATVPVRPLAHELRSPSFLFIGAFVVLMAAVTSALPAHMISLLREVGMNETWVIAVPASIGVVQVLGRLLLFFFEHHFDVHLANRLIPCLVPMGLAALIAGQGHGWAAMLFVLLYGMGNGMLTIVKGTAMAQYVNRHHVASLNGALGLPTAVARAAAPLIVGLAWSRESGYGPSLWGLLCAGSLAVLALLLAQKYARPQTD